MRFKRSKIVGMERIEGDDKNCYLIDSNGTKEISSLSRYLDLKNLYTKPLLPFNTMSNMLKQLNISKVNIDTGVSKLTLTSIKNGSPVDYKLKSIILVSNYLVDIMKEYDGSLDI